MNEQKIDLTGISKTEAFISIIKAYEKEFLLNCNIETIQISDGAD